MALPVSGYVPVSGDIVSFPTGAGDAVGVVDRNLR